MKETWKIRIRSTTMSNEPKKLAILRILEILQERTDEDHLLTQSEISSILK